MRPEVLAWLAGPGGELDPGVEQRLGRASRAGEELGARLGLDGAHQATLGQLFVEHAFRVLREERAAGAPLDPERIDAITADTLAGVRAAAGGPAAEAARAPLAGL